MYTKNQYINDLWNKNPEMMKRMLKKILSLKKQDSIWLYDKFEDGFSFRYCYYDDDPRKYRSIMVDDFEILYDGQGRIDTTCMKWMVFMLKLYGKQYIEDFEASRNSEMEQYVSRFSNKTNIVVNELNKIYDKDCQKQTKKTDEQTNHL